MLYGAGGVVGAISRQRHINKLSAAIGSSLNTRNKKKEGMIRMKCCHISFDTAACVHSNCDSIMAQSALGGVECAASYVTGQPERGKEVGVD